MILIGISFNYISLSNDFYIAIYGESRMIYICADVIHHFNNIAFL